MLAPLTNQVMTMILAIVLINALAMDLHDRRIPNPLIGIGLLAGVVGHAWFTGLPGLWLAVSGAVTGLLCLLPFYASGGMGAGDVKLMAVCGAFLGPLHIILAAAATLMIGGIIGMAWLFWHSVTIAGPLRRSDAPSHLQAAESDETAAVPRLPYAVAIVAGVLAEVHLGPSIADVWAGGLL